MRYDAPIAPSDPMDSAAAESPGRKQLREFYRILLARRRVIVTTVVAITATVLVLTLLATPEYLATSTVQIEQIGPDILSFKDVLTADRSFQGTGKFYQTQYKLLRSRAVLEGAAKQLDLLSRPEFVQRRPSPVARLRAWVRDFLPSGPIAPPDPVGAAADYLQGRLTVEPIRDSQLVEISFMHGDPALARDAANAVADAYVSFVYNARYKTTAMAKDFLTKEVSTVQAEIAKLERDLQEYGSSKDILSVSDGGSDIGEQALSDLNRQHVEARSRMALAEARTVSVHRAEPNALAEVVNSPLIARLKEQYSDIQRQHSQMAERFKDDWPPLRQLKFELQQAEARLETQAEAVATQVRLVADADFERARGEEERLRAQVDRQKTDVQSTKLDAIEYANRRTEIATKRMILADLVGRQGETESSDRLRATDSSNIRIVDEAKLPKAPARPKKLTNMMLALALGLVAGVAMAFVLEHLDNTIQSGDDIGRLTGLPVLSHVPQYAPLHAADADAARREDQLLDLASHTDPRSSFSEAFKSVRTSLLLASAEPPRTLMITSCQPKDGKSTASVNLAIALAQLGGRVLLVDADLRVPRLHKVLHVPNAVGLSSFLSGMTPLEAAIVDTEIPGLRFMPSGPIPPNPSELLGSARLPWVLAPASVEGGHDWVVFDSSPLLSVTDPFILASYVDATVLVVRAGETTRDSVRHAIARLRQARARVVGVIFNGITEGTGEYYYGRYRYEYVDDPAAEKQERRRSSDKPPATRKKRWAGRG